MATFVDGRLDADFYICGPGPFMDLVEATLLGLGVEPDAIAIERFETVVDPGTAATPRRIGPRVPDSIVLILRGKKHEIEYHAGDTVLEAARRADAADPLLLRGRAAAPPAWPSSSEGAVTMRVNDALTPEEVAEGWVLTCQSRPTGPALTVEFEPL